MPFRVYCKNCHIEDAVRTRADLNEWHGQHKIRSEEIDETEYTRIKRGRGAKNNRGSNNPNGENQSGYGGTCPLCDKEFEGQHVAHLRNECEG